MMGARKVIQKQKILMWLKEHGSITPMDALIEFGCMRLGARIWDLRHEGYPIEKVMEEHVNADGNITRYARYFLREVEAA